MLITAILSVRDDCNQGEWRMGSRIFATWRWAAMACAAATWLPLAPAPARADSLAELDALSQSTASVAPGLALARRQIGNGELLGALATLERLLMHRPDAGEALLLHASLLCRLDDRSGSVVEFDYLRGHGVPDQLWNEATAPCQPNAKSDLP